MMRERIWPLRSVLSALLVITMLVTFSIVGGVILLVRIPQLQKESRAEVTREVRELTVRVEILLGALESQMSFLSQTLQKSASVREANAVLDRATGDGHEFRAIYLVSGKGTVLAAGVAPDLRPGREDLLGSDLSATQLFVLARKRRQVIWGDKVLSALSGAVTVGLVYPMAGDRILLAEVPLSYLLSTVELAAGQRSSSIWLVDRIGEIIADTQDGRTVGAANMQTLPIMQAALRGEELPRVFSFGGRDYYPAVARSQKLDWYFVAGQPAGWANQQIRSAVLFVVAGFAGSLLVGLLLATFWAAWLARPLGRIVKRADQVTRGESIGEWPRGRVAEVNHLSADLEKMANALQEREQKSQAIFNTSPVPMAVADVDRQFVLLDVNEAWCREFGRTRETVLGRTGTDIGLWHSLDERQALMREGLPDVRGEARLVRGDGTVFLCQTFGRRVRVGESRLMIWATVDISELRRIENELRQLNAELEARVSNRTQALASLNDELTRVIAHLRQTQGDLVRSEKMAALGSLVAGVAHELNTPLGNSLMVATSLTHEAHEFRGLIQAGLRRSDLEKFVSGVEQAADIATRNLQRAAELVSSFKQVAVDQTSSQRRFFELAEVVEEMITSLRPTLRRTPYKIEVEVPPAGLLLDSYPGPLGQTIGNLINNAVLHGFDGRAHGTIRIVGLRDQDGLIVLRLSDDGKGIPAALLPRIFDPFMTTRMGRGGTGLGLNIAYNAVVNLLGGTLTVRSEEGLGTTFELRLPPKAPRISEADPRV